MTSYNNPNDPNYLGDKDVVRDGDRSGNFWPWVIGLLVLLAVGWIVIEAFDGDDEFNGNDAVPAAGEIRDDVGTVNRDNMSEQDPTLRDQTIGTDRSGTGQMSEPQNSGTSTGGNPGGAQ